MFKSALIFGGAYALGSLGGEQVANVAGFKSEGARVGTKIAVGVIAFGVLSSILR